MRTEILLPVEYAYRVLVLLGQVAEELAETRLIILPHLWSGSHGEAIRDLETAESETIMESRRCGTVEGCRSWYLFPLNGRRVDAATTRCRFRASTRLRTVLIPSSPHFLSSPIQHGHDIIEP
jgi:hypothetical protein